MSNKLLISLLKLLLLIWDWILLTISMSLWISVGLEDAAFASWVLWAAVYSANICLFLTSVNAASYKV